jgi:chromosome segregation ATPase
MSRNRWAVLAALCLIAWVQSAAGGAHAQSLDDKLRAQLRTTLGQLHDLENSQAALEAQKAAAEQERDALKAKLAAGGGRAAPRAAEASPALQAELDRQKAENARLMEANKQAQADIAKYKDAYAQVVESSQQIHADRDRMAQESATDIQLLAACETKNIQLVKIGRDVLAAYAKIGVKDALERGEPMIGLKRVKLERLAQEYGDKVYEAKFDPRAVKPAAPPANPTPAATPPVKP